MQPRTSLGSAMSAARMTCWYHSGKSSSRRGLIADFGTSSLAIYEARYLNRRAEIDQRRFHFALRFVRDPPDHAAAPGRCLALRGARGNAATKRTSAGSATLRRAKRLQAPFLATLPHGLVSTNRKSSTAARLRLNFAR